MKRLVLATAALLAACSPLTSGGTLTREPGTVVFTNPDRLTARTPTVLLDGADLKVSLVVDGQERCARRASGRWGCVLPDVAPGGRQAILVLAGTVTGGDVTWYEDDSPVPIHRDLQ